MARKLFGLRPGEVVATAVVDADDAAGEIASSGEVFAPTTATFDVYEAMSGGVAVTDLQDLDGNSITAVTADDLGRTPFQGEDDYAGGYWLQDQADVSAEPVRWLVEPSDLADVVAALAGAGVDFYTLPGTGIPKSDLDAATQALIDGAVQGDGDATSILMGDGSETVVGTPGQVVQVNDAGDGLEYADLPAGSDISGKADKSGSVSQFADWDEATAPVDGDVPVYDDGTNEYVPTDLSGLFAGLDSADRLAPSNWQKYFVPIVVLNEGDSAPADFPVGGIGFVRPSAPSLIPILEDTETNNGASGATTLVMSGPTEDLNVDDWVGIAILTDASTTTGALPTTISSIALAVGAWTLTNSPLEAHQSGTVQVNLLWAKVTTLIPAGTDITITLNQTRTHRTAFLFKMPNLASVPADQTISNQGNSASGASPVALSAGPSGDTAQANELGILVVGHNDGGAGITRVVGGTNGWSVLGAVESDNTVTSRTLTVLWKIYSAVGPLQGTVAVTTSDGATGAYAIVGKSFKAA